MKIVASFLIIIYSLTSQAFIPRGMLILQKTAENSGSGIYQIEQEVQFPMAQDHFVLKETWWVENENTLRLLVTGTKEYKDLIRMNFLYVGGQKLQLRDGKKQSEKISEDFLEKYFHFRSPEAFANSLIALKIVPIAIFNKKPIRSMKDFEYQPEQFIRLSRVGGVIDYAFGTPSNPNSKEGEPGLWIEQDQFVIRKLKLPSHAEITAEKHSQYSRGLMFPRKRTISWDNSSVQIQTLTVIRKSRQASLFSPTNLELTKIDAISSLPIRSTIEDFYKRFR
jgi:hypothetical protein